MEVNDFSMLDAQTAEGRLAQVGPWEQDSQEFDAWMNQVAQATPEPRD